jgi:hypothetical protein
MNFKPSDKVVCIRDDGFAGAESVVLQGGLPKKDVVYVVRETFNGWCGYFGQTPSVGLRLVGIICACQGELEYGWDSTCFRKLEEIQAESKLKREQEEAAALKEATQLINSEP